MSDDAYRRPRIRRGSLRIPEAVWASLEVILILLVLSAIQLLAMRFAGG